MSEKEGFALIILLFAALPIYLAVAGDSVAKRTAGMVLAAPLLVLLVAILVL